ncbi:MAG: F0F1 ATP synthase subunit delta [Gammaproteobacteria bacterium]|nr:F0F1 ATP synthase subunit delta [Gammaproteobacteria bacterium]
MAEKLTIARPYAEAVFSLASSHKRLNEWSKTLHAAAAVAGSDALRTIVGNPKVPRAKLAELINEVCGKDMDKFGQNLVRLLAENGRLAVLPEIAELYEAYKAEAEKTVQAEMIAAFPVSDEQKTRVAAALKTRLGREVTLECRTDTTLVGGAVIRAGDLVIDGSVSGKLDKLVNVLSH